MELYATVQVRQELSLLCLTALYWDSIVTETADTDELNRPVRLVMWDYKEYTSPAVVRERVRDQLAWYGSRSVECGPNVDYPSEEVERQLKMIVARAYKLVY